MNEKTKKIGEYRTNGSLPVRTSRPFTTITCHEPHVNGEKERGGTYNELLFERLLGLSAVWRRLLWRNDLFLSPHLNSYFLIGIVGRIDTKKITAIFKSSTRDISAALQNMKMGVGGVLISSFRGLVCAGRDLEGFMLSSSNLFSPRQRTGHVG